MVNEEIIKNALYASYAILETNLSIINSKGAPKEAKESAYTGIERGFELLNRVEDSHTSDKFGDAGIQLLLKYRHILSKLRQIYKKSDLIPLEDLQAKIRELELETTPGKAIPLQ
jgi:hypothetical protein